MFFMNACRWLYVFRQLTACDTYTATKQNQTFCQTVWMAIIITTDLRLPSHFYWKVWRNLKRTTYCYTSYLWGVNGGEYFFITWKFGFYGFCGKIQLLNSSGNKHHVANQNKTFY